MLLVITTDQAPVHLLWRRRWGHFQHGWHPRCLLPLSIRSHFFHITTSIINHHHHHPDMLLLEAQRSASSLSPPGILICCCLKHTRCVNCTREFIWLNFSIYWLENIEEGIQWLKSFSKFWLIRNQQITALMRQGENTVWSVIVIGYKKLLYITLN